MKRTYIVMAILGAVLPLSAFIPWAAEHGLDAGLFVEELFANRISSFFAFDVIVTALVLFAFTYDEWRRQRLRRPWIPVIATLLVGVSLGLPLLLLAREPNRG